MLVMSLLNCKGVGMVTVTVIDRNLVIKAEYDPLDLYYCEKCDVYHVHNGGHVREAGSGLLYCPEVGQFDVECGCQSLEPDCG